MKSDEFFGLLGGIDSKMIAKASEDMMSWQESQKGVVVQAGSSRRPSLRIAAVCAVCAAVMIGVFALIMNIRKNGIGTVSEPENS